MVKNWICLLYAETILVGITTSFKFERNWIKKHEGHWSKWINNKTGENYSHHYYDEDRDDDY